MTNSKTIFFFNSIENCTDNLCIDFEQKQSQTNNKILY